MNFRRELHLFLREGTLPAIFLLLAFLFGMAFWSGQRWLDGLRGRAADGRAIVERQVAELKEGLEAFEAGTLEELPKPNPQSAATAEFLTNPYLEKREGPLAVTAIGESDVRTSLSKSGPPGDPTWVNDDILNPLSLATGRLDVAFVVVALLPLFAIGLTFRLLSAEREGGTLPLLKGQPVALAKILLARTGIRYGALLAISAMAFGIGLAWTTGLPSPQWMLGWIGVVAVYLGFWCLLGAFVNFFGRSSGSNVVILVGAWVVWVVLVPVLVNLGASSLHRAPTRTELLIAYRQAMEHSEPDEAFVMAYLRPFKKYWSDPQTPPNHWGLRRLALEAHAREEIAPKLRQAAEAKTRRSETVAAMQWLSPAIAAQLALIALAGNDAASFDAFDASVAREHLRREEFFLPKRLNQLSMTRADYDRIPAPSPAPQAGWLPSGAVLALLMLTGLLGLGLGLRARSRGFEGAVARKPHSTSAPEGA